MTDFYGKVQQQLAGIAGDEGAGEQEGGGVGDQGESIVLLWSKEAEVAATALMQRVAAVKGEAGLHFAGVPMTIQKAITVGTAIVYLSQYFPFDIRPHFVSFDGP
jgi:hypothetical protein